MRCLYCGKELALLKRLTGGGEFCSDTHKQSYQEEYNRLALSRLLQAQSKPGESQIAKNAPPARPAPPAATAVAVQEPVEETVREETPREEVVHAAAVAREHPVAHPAKEQPVVQEASFTPPDSAGYFAPKLALAALKQSAPYLERWLDSAVAPAMPDWLFPDSSSTLPAAQLLPLDVHPGIRQQEHSLTKPEVAPQEFTNGKLDLNVAFPGAKSSHEFPSAGAITLRIAPVPAETCPSSLNGAIGHRAEVMWQGSALLERSQSGIEFLPEDSDVNMAPAQLDAAVPPVDLSAAEALADAGVAEPEPEAPSTESTATPRAALEALSRLHEGLVEPERATAEAPPEVVRVPEVVPVKLLPEIVEKAPVESLAPPAPAEDHPLTPEVSEFLTIPLKTFAPSKPNLLIDSDALLTLAQPLLPRLKALPLRPKVGLAPPGFTQPARAVPARSPLTDAKFKASAGPARTDVQRKPLSRPKPDVPQPAPPEHVAEPEQKQPAQAARAAQPAPPPPAQHAPSGPSKPPAETLQPAARTARPSSMREPVRTPPARKDEPRVKPVQPPAAAQPPAPGEPTLTFETLQLQLMANTNVPFWGSLKFKLGLAILLVVGGGVTYSRLGGKSHPPANAGTSIDAVGPSIMVGEGGWVQGWAGDPVGEHLGRQITIYRPSLTLSDYRIEFQGQIETKSLGWVFRAADPDNYYAMKLTSLSSGLPQKVVLIKYMILKGHETELGRIPIDGQVSNATVFSVRMDIRGPRFNTYIQGQPVDMWTNDQLKSGGVGFLNERGERGKIKSVSISYLNGAEK